MFSICYRCNHYRKSEDMRDTDKGVSGQKCRYCTAKYSARVFEIWRDMDELLSEKIKLRYDVLASTTSERRAGKIAAEALKSMRDGEVLIYPMPKRMTPADRLIISHLHGEGSVLLTLENNVVLVFLQGSNNRVVMYQVKKVDVSIPPVAAEELLTEAAECDLCNNNARCFLKCGRCDKQICETCHTNIYIRAKYMSNALGGKCPYCRYDAIQHLNRVLATA